MKQANFSEGEHSEEDDSMIELHSSGKRSNYTNTSVHVVGNEEDSSSQTSGLSGNFGYLNSSAVKQKLR